MFMSLMDALQAIVVYCPRHPYPNTSASVRYIWLGGYANVPD